MIHYIEAIDPGPEESAVVAVATDYMGMLEVRHADNLPNATVLSERMSKGAGQCARLDRLIIEGWVPGGSSIGAESIATIEAMAVFHDRAVFAGAVAKPEHVIRMNRPRMKLELGLPKTASDADVRARLIDLFGGKEAAIGKRKTAPGPLAAITGSHLWAALALAVAYVQSVRDEALRARRIEEGAVFAPRSET